MDVKKEDNKHDNRMSQYSIISVKVLLIKGNERTKPKKPEQRFLEE